ncbi:hypothetical protein J2Z50_000590 [Ensifer mexicanus]|nr:hypothetical protein [Sinorhizobium mexicanum]
MHTATVVLTAAKVEVFHAFGGGDCWNEGGLVSVGINTR